MENVTKALLIAAAVIVVLVIIGLGMYYLNTARQQMGDTHQLDDAQIAQFNAPFVNYQGLQNGSSVINLISAVNSHNMAHNDDVDLQISINNIDSAAAGGAAVTVAGGNRTTPNTYDLANHRYTVGAVKKSKRYTVTLNYVGDDTTSYICNIEITEV